MERNWLRNLVASDIRKGIFSFFFLLLFTSINFLPILYLLIFIGMVTPFPPPQPCFFGGRREPGGRTRSVDDFLCYPTKWNNCLFLQHAHTGLLCHPARSTMGRVSLESFLPLYSEDQNSYSTEILTPTTSWNHCLVLQPSALIHLFTLMN